MTLTPWSTVLLEKLIVSQLVEKNTAVSETEDSLSYLQEPSYPEPDESSKQPIFLGLKLF
jgi:hypothetical protein